MDEPISKSQKKRDAEYLQKIGVKLIDLKPLELSKLPLTPVLHQAILEAKKLKSHGAMRRQAQLIGKLMRAADSDAIIAAFEAIKNEDNAQTAAFHHIEQWRERLINESNDVLTQFIMNYPQANSQQLRHLIKKAIDEKKTNQSLGASKALFRFLRECLQ